MHFQYINYLWVLVTSAAIMAALGLYAWRHRAVSGAQPFVLISMTAVLWSLANALEMAGTDLPTKIFWANVQYLCYGLLPVGWLALALQYTGRSQWLTRRHLAWLLIVPCITLVLVWTNDFHGLMRRDVYLDTAGPFPVVGKTYGPWFWIHAVYSYSLFLITIYLLLQVLRQGRRLYRGQPLVLLISLLLPLVWNVLYTSGLSPVPRHDVAPAVSSLSGLVAAWGLFRYRLLDIVPVARDTIIENLDSGVIVLDAQDRVVDVNPTAEDILGCLTPQAIGRQATQVFKAWPDLLALYHDALETRAGIVLGPGDAQNYYESHISPLVDRQGQLAGQVIILHDVTELTRVQAQLIQQQLTLAVLEERERIARELHDSLGQVLGYVNAQAQAVRELLSRGQTDTADEYLARMVAIAQEAHADVRDYIVSVKAGISSKRGFLSSLAQQLQRFSQNYELQTELIVPDGLAQEAIEPAVEAQLLRIVQEALVNVRKHAGARSVRVSLAMDGHELGGQVMQIVVEDDGCGFEPALLSTHSEQTFGLRIMRERAAGIGSSLQVHSTPGQGTKVIVRVPLSEGRRDGFDEDIVGG
jgi:PAS domain S-box-containing protein